MVNTHNDRLSMRVRRRITDGLRAFSGRLSNSRQPIFYRRSRGSLKIPAVPPEVWAIILQHACLCDYDPLDTSQELSFLETSCTQLATYRASLRVKLNFALVCKQWNALSRPLLYEFVWISRAAQAKLLARTLLHEWLAASKSSNACTSGTFIRRLHIETLALERCTPADLRTILDFAPYLFIFSDHHSVRRNLFESKPDPRCSPEEILKLVAHPSIRRLSWTCYDDTPFEQRMRVLETNLTTRLEYLELSCCSPHFQAIVAESLAHSRMAQTSMNVHLPALRALKVSLDNSTFAALASWDMPRLTNLSVLSSDFSYTGAGFTQFFKAHGAKLRQLELGHSSALIEEFYLTTPRHILQLQHAQMQRPRLAELCPNLREFICSADAEWHWQSPDWIAPHILLPAHPKVELIGIRDIDKRLAPGAGGGGQGGGGALATPFFPLYAQIASLLRRDAFPQLRYVRDMSAASHSLRAELPETRVLQFWRTVVKQCQERAVWLEDYRGVNITLRNLQQAMRLVTSDVKASRWSDV